MRVNERERERERERVCVYESEVLRGVSGISVCLRQRETQRRTENKKQYEIHVDQKYTHIRTHDLALFFLNTPLLPPPPLTPCFCTISRRTPKGHREVPPSCMGHLSQNVTKKTGVASMSILPRTCLSWTLCRYLLIFVHVSFDMCLGSF